MPTAIALLRGINVGGKNMIPMADLRGLLESLGFGDVRTLLQSGNVVFHHDGRSSTQLEELLEVQTELRFKLRVDYCVRSFAELELVIEGNPFKKEAETEPSHLIAMFLKGAVKADGESALRAANKGPETFHLRDRQLYAFYPDGMGNSKFTGALIESRLGTRCTGRNWNTVLKLAAMAKV